MKTFTINSDNNIYSNCFIKLADKKRNNRRFLQSLETISKHHFEVEGREIIKVFLNLPPL